MFWGFTDWGTSTYQAAAGLPLYLMQGMMFNPNKGLCPEIKQSLFNFGYSLGENLGYSTMAKAKAQRINSNLNQSQSDLDSALKSGKLTSEEKEEAKELKKKLAKLEEKFADLTESSTNSAEELLAELNKLEEEYWELQDEILAFRDKVKERVKAEEAKKKDDTDEVEDSEEVEETEEVDETEGSEETEATEKKNKKEKTKSKTLESEFGITTEPTYIDTARTLLGAEVKNESKAIVDIMFQKIDGPGSDGVDKYIMQNVNEDNVIEVLLQWNQTYAMRYISDDQYGLVQTIYNEYFINQADTVRHIISAMQKRLEKYKNIDDDIYQSAKMHLNEAMNGTKNTFTFSVKAVATNVNFALTEIVKLMNKSTK